MPSASLRLTDSLAASRFAPLNDMTWWRQNGHQTNTAIALLVGCSIETVRLARARQDVPSLPRGRPPASYTTRKPVPRSFADDLIAERSAKARERGVPASEQALEQAIAAHTRDYSEAKLAGEPAAQMDAAISAASAWSLLVEHSRMLRRAA